MSICSWDTDGDADGDVDGDVDEMSMGMSMRCRISDTSNFRYVEFSICRIFDMSNFRCAFRPTPAVEAKTQFKGRIGLQSL